MASSNTTSAAEDYLVQIASYNTNLQTVEGLPQDLVDWMAPTLRVSSFLSNQQRSPDIVAVGFQELLPLHLGLSGLSKPVLQERERHILEQIEAHSPNKAKYSLIGKIVNVGVALLVFAIDDGVGRSVCDVQTQWTGCGIGYMGNKGAVGIRFRVPALDGGVGETFTFVCAHLTAHAEKLQHRIHDYSHIVGSLAFPALPGSPTSEPTTIYSTSHLFFFGDLNFRLDLPESHPFHGLANIPHLTQAMSEQSYRELLKEYDQLLTERRKGSIFVGLREGRFWDFKCSYKYELGEVDTYSQKRIPSWTDRILYATHSDSASTPESTNIKNILYTSIPSFMSSDHKPIVSLLLVPHTPLSSSKAIPLIQLSTTPTCDPNRNLKRYSGRILDRFIGLTWWLLTLIGAGSSVFGVFNFVLGLGAWKWWRSSSAVSL